MKADRPNLISYLKNNPGFSITYKGFLEIFALDDATGYLVKDHFFNYRIGDWDYTDYPYENCNEAVDKFLELLPKHKEINY